MRCLYRQTKSVLDKLELSTADMGTLENTGSVDCTVADAVPSDAAVYFATTPIDGTSPVSPATRVGVTASVMVVSAVLALFMA